MSKTVFIVDDDPGLRQVMTYALEAAGYLVRSADSRDAALRCLQDGDSVDVIVLDVWLGRDNGLELFDELRGILPNVPVVFISGGSDKMALETTTAIADMKGAAEFLYKPFGMQSLVDTLEKLISSDTA